MIQEIAPKTQSEINEITTFLSSEFHRSFRTDLISICTEEEIIVKEDHYEDYFDGLIVYDAGAFYIHLNLDKGNAVNTKRGRFTLAHELGHFFINAHRRGLEYKLLPMHPTNHMLVHSHKMEVEADYFASCLLMPRDRLRNFTARRKFSLKIIEEISNEFDVSLTSALIRFAHVGTHEILAVFSKQNKVEWFCVSSDFPKLPFKFKVKGQLPPSTVAGEYFSMPNKKLHDEEMVDLEDWFYWKPWAPQTQLYEQCFYSDMYDYVISLIWFK